MRQLGWGYLLGVLVAVMVGAPPAAAQSCAPLACSEILVNLPYQLDFDGDHGKILDTNGVGTGLTYIDPPTNGSGYLPQNLLMDTAAGELRITTTAGLSLEAVNSLDNALAVGIDAPSQVTRVETTINDPPAGSAQFQQGGLWFGNDEDNYFKLNIISTSSGTSLQYYKEVGGVVIQHATGPVLDLAGHSVTLTLIADPVTKEIEASYRVDDGPRLVRTTVALPDEFFSFDAAGIDPEIGTDSFGGIYASHRNGPAPLEYDFESFSVTKERDVAANPLTEGIAFNRSSFPVPNPTSIAVGPDGRVYVSEILGTIHALTLDQEMQVVDDEVITTLGERLTLGLTIDPSSTPEDVILWASHSSPSLDAGVPNSSVVSRLSGPGLAQKEDVITGLPRALANHAVNSIHFGPDGKLYIALGGNTGAGAPNDSGSEFGEMQEQPLSAALLVADVKAAGFDGSCNNESDIFGPPPCDVNTHSTGLRNTYDFVFHSNGLIYAPDNGLGVTGTYPPSPSPPCLGFGDTALWNADPPGDNPGSQPDELNILEQGDYYGHPNPYRDECVFGDGSQQGVSPLPNYHPPLFNLGNNKSTNGAIEYTSAAHCEALKGDLLLANYSIGDNLSRIELSEDGHGVLRAETLASGFDDPLPVAQGPDGTIYVGELGAGQVTALAPVNLGCWKERSPLPVDLLDAGGTALGGKLYVVGGKDAGGHSSEMHVYDPARDSWSTGPSLPGPAVENPAVAPYDGKLYAFGGSTSAFSGAVTNAAVFDPVTNAWTALPEMPTARGGPTAKAIGDEIYVAGGMSGTGGSLTTLEVFDPAAGTWASAAPMSTARDNPGSAVFDDKLYIFGGRTRDASSGTEVNGTLATVEMYDPTTDLWTPRAPMPTGRRTMVVGQLNGKAQLMGGERRPSPPGTFPANEEYDPATDSWRTLTPMRTPRHGAAAGTIGGVVYVAGGGSAAGTSFVPANEALSFNPFVPPAVTTDETNSEDETSATLNGTVNPQGQATIYHFEYGTTTAYGSQTPTPDGEAGTDLSGQPVAATIGGLQPGTTYHYRLVAQNGSGITEGADLTFKTASVAGPPPAPATQLCGGREVTILGDDGPDRLRGTAGADVILGLGGADRIRGAGGADLICGARGGDVIRGGPGRDSLFGARGPDRLLGGNGIDFCIGSFGRDGRFGCERPRL